jgi:hypothetical protein
MLKESTAMMTSDGLMRRWFYDDQFDLIIWVWIGSASPERLINSFELCYEALDRPLESQDVAGFALRWSHDHGFQQFSLNRGRSSKTRRSAGVLVATGDRPRLDQGLIQQFQGVSHTLEAPLRQFILDRLYTLQ